MVWAMSERPTVLSLDLGETVFWDTREILAAQTAARVGALAAGISRASGAPFTFEEVAGARERVLSRWGQRGLLASSLPNVDLVREVLAELGARPEGVLEDLAERYSSAGLREHPPQLNPEARVLTRSVADRGVPVIVTSNTSRSGRTWKAFLTEVWGLPILEAVTSCDLGARKPDPRLFLEGAHRLNVEPSRVLHIGDRWDRDVVGAEGAGMQAALYRGLWGRYWNPEEGPPVHPPSGTSVPCLDHLTDASALF